MDEQYLIHEVAEKAGVSTRTIRYYITEGLLPAPTTRGRYAYYDPAYIDLIQLIRQLKENYLPLREIKLLVQDISPERIQELLQSSARMKKLQQESGMNRGLPEDDGPDLSTASAYIDHLRQVRLEEKPARGNSGSATFTPVEPEPDFLQEQVNRHDIDKPAFARKPAMQESSPNNDPFWLNAQLDASEIQPKSSRNDPAGIETSTWRRYSIVEGVELNIRDDAEQRTGGKLADIIRTIRQLFKLI